MLACLPCSFAASVRGVYPEAGKFVDGEKKLHRINNCIVENNIYRLDMSIEVDVRCQSDLLSRCWSRVHPGHATAVRGISSFTLHAPP